MTTAQTEARAVDALAKEMRAGLEGVQGGPWHMDTRAVYIYAPAERGGDFPLGDNLCGGHFNEVMRLRGWGYYTGRGHGALGLDADEASRRQNLTGQHIARCHPDNMRAILDDRDAIAQQNAELRAELAALKKEAADVVRPFAENAPPGNGEGSFELPDSHPITFRSDAPDTPSIIVGHFRAARSFLDKWEGRE